MVHFIMHWLGLDNGTGPAYLFWSGFAGDLIYIGALGGLLKLYRTKNCKVKGCFRIGRHPVEGTPYKTCHKHATVNTHKELHLHHERSHPAQHKLFNQGVRLAQGRDSHGRFARR